MYLLYKEKEKYMLMLVLFVLVEQHSNNIIHFLRNLVVPISNPCKTIKLFVCMITPKSNMSFQRIVPQNYFPVFLGLLCIFATIGESQKHTYTLAAYRFSF